MHQPSYFIEPDQLEALRNDENIIIVDLCAAGQYTQTHTPNAHWIQYSDIKKVNKPVMGLLPDNDHFSALLSALGITKKSLVVTYDDVNCGCTARFVWTLHVFGHDKAVVLNGGLHSWKNEGHTLNNIAPDKPVHSNYKLVKMASLYRDVGFYTGEAER